MPQPRQVGRLPQRCGKRASREPHSAIGQVKSHRQCVLSLANTIAMDTITWDDFSKVQLRVGRVLQADVFEQARKPAYILHVDFGPELGVRKSSAQITVHYQPQELVGRLVVAVVNFPAKQIGPIMSECLVTGFHDADGAVRLCVPDGDVPLGTRLL